ncbi:MAG: class I SAM-dependent RNA methyltransferase [Phycisphaerae bacterium]|nr:class I SAM-dependent RNA methyltransferase [Phycisphaerae bacterium]
MDFTSQAAIRLTCPRGAAELLRAEIEQLGFRVDTVGHSVVETSGTLIDAMRMNLHLRTAVNVLYQLAQFPCDGPDELYRAVRDVPWENWLSPDTYFTVVSRGNHPSIDNFMYVNQRVKDAVVDRMIEHFGRRPDTGSERDGFVLNVIWFGETAELFVNTSGRKLSDRGYRKLPHDAPMSESLAAAVILATGYDGSVSLTNPMCGSGTLAIEAALIATGRPPGLFRTHYGFQHIRGFDEDAWREMRIAAKKMRNRVEPKPIVATDMDPRAIDAARRNAETAGVHHMIEFHQCDFTNTPLPSDKGVVVLNPEYGMRMGEIKALESTYARIGDFFKQKCRGHSGYVFSGNLELAKKIGLTAKRRIIFFNARIECRLLMYELYEGSRRKPKPGAESAADSAQHG